MAATIEALFLPLMKKQLPEIVDFHMPFEGIFHNLALVSIEKQYPVMSPVRRSFLTAVVRYDNVGT